LTRLLRIGPLKAWIAVAVLGISAIAGLEGYALSQGINGSTLTAALTAIAGIGGAGFGRALK